MPSGPRGLTWDAAGASTGAYSRAYSTACRRCARASPRRTVPRLPAEDHIATNTPRRPSRGLALSRRGSPTPKAGLAQMARWTGRAPVDQSRQAIGLVAMHPVLQRLAVHPAGLSRRRAVDTFQDQSQGQHPPRRPHIRRCPRRCSQLEGAQFQPRDGDPRHRYCLAKKTANQRFRNLETPEGSKIGQLI